MILNNFKHQFLEFINKNKFNKRFIVSLIFFNILYIIFTFLFHQIYQETDGFIFSVYFHELINGIHPPIDSEYWPPGMPVIIGLISFLTGDYFVAARVVIVEFAILFLCSIYLIMKTIFNEEVAFFTYLFFATNHFIILHYYFIIVSDIIFSFFILISIYFLIRNKSMNNKNLIYSGIFLSLATLIRWSGLFFIPILTLKILFQQFSIADNEIKKKLFFSFKKSIILISTFFIILSPYLLLNTFWYGSPFYNIAIRNVYRSMHPTDWVSRGFPEDLSWFWLFFGPESNLFYKQWMRSFFIGNPFLISKFIMFYYIEPFEILFGIMIIPVSIYFFLLLCCFLGYYINNKLKKEKNISKRFIFSSEFFLFLVFIIYVLITSLAKNKFRYLYPVLPIFVAPIISITIITIKKIFKYFKSLKFGSKISHTFLKRFKFSSFIFLLFLLISGVQLAISTNSAFYQSSEEKEEYKIAGEYMKGVLEHDDLLYINRRNYLYYIGNYSINYETFPNSENFTKFLSLIKNGDYIIICERIEAKERPNLAFLLDSSSPRIPSYFNPIFIHNETNRRIIIYRILE